jgi:hypothetical protein
MLIFALLLILLIVLILLILLIVLILHILIILLIFIILLIVLILGAVDRQRAQSAAKGLRQMQRCSGKGLRRAPGSSSVCQNAQAVLRWQPGCSGGGTGTQADTGVLRWPPAVPHHY